MWGKKHCPCILNITSMCMEKEKKQPSITIISLVEYLSYLFLEMLVPTNKVFTFSIVLISLKFTHAFFSVRSVASVAHMKSLDSRKQFHFDFFTVDFNEELSALYGGVLQRQVSFVQLCIRKILQIYKKKTQSQNSVVLIAHSMVIFLFFHFFTNMFHLFIE